MSTEASSAMEFAVVDTALQHTAAVKVTVPMAGIPQAHMQARPRIMAALPGLVAVEPGLTCTRWHMAGEGQIYMEIGCIVGQSFSEQGDIEPGTLPAGRAAHYTLFGGFEGLGGAWGRLFAWCEAQGHELAGDNWEVYGETPADPALQRTDLFALIK